MEQMQLFLHKTAKSLLKKYPLLLIFVSRVPWAIGYTAPSRFLVVLLRFVCFVCIYKLWDDIHKYGQNELDPFKKRR